MLAAFCLVVLFIFCGLLLGLIEVACAKNAEKKETSAKKDNKAKKEPVKTK